MATFKRKSDFINSEQGQEVKRMLRQMATDSAFNTTSSYDPNSDKYPDNQKPFDQKHMDYLMAHPGLDPSKYLANLRLMTRIK